MGPPVTGAVGLPHGRWRHAFTDEDINGGDADIAALLRPFPVALLERQTSA